MEYKLTETKLEKVKLSEDGTTLSLDYTITGQMIDGEIILAINTGTTIELPCPSGLAEAAESKITEYFNNKYKSK